MVSGIASRPAFMGREWLHRTLPADIDWIAMRVNLVRIIERTLEFETIATV